MLTTENVKQLVRGFLHEACGYLGIDDSQIGIIYMPMPVQMMVALLKEADDIVIDNKWYLMLFRYSLEIISQLYHLIIRHRLFPKLKKSTT